MYQVNDQYANLIFEFSQDHIRDRENKIIGLIRNGGVCDRNDTPTQCSIVGTQLPPDRATPTAPARTSAGSSRRAAPTASPRRRIVMASSRPRPR
jgi:hypothetical protein